MALERRRALVLPQTFIEPTMTSLGQTLSFDTRTALRHDHAMLGEPENQFSLTRAALSTRGAQKRILINQALLASCRQELGDITTGVSGARCRPIGSVAHAEPLVNIAPPLHRHVRSARLRVAARPTRPYLHLAIIEDSPQANNSAHPALRLTLSALK